MEPRIVPHFLYWPLYFTINYIFDEYLRDPSERNSFHDRERINNPWSWMEVNGSRNNHNKNAFVKTLQSVFAFSFEFLNYSSQSPENVRLIIYRTTSVRSMSATHFLITQYKTIFFRGTSLKTVQVFERFLFVNIF